jgi:prepilin-type N-terminal cleavage/methylation domain-containing protein
VNIKVSNLLKKEKGFTLIEIVLVLAIAGLLLVIVFLAVSGAQRSRRDSQRKNDLSRLSAQIENYASNTNGSYPANLSIAAFTPTYLPSNFKDPSSGAAYAPGALGTVGNYLYTFGAGNTACDGATALSGRQYKVQMQLEQGVACVDNR